MPSPGPPQGIKHGHHPAWVTPGWYPAVTPPSVRSHLDSAQPLASPASGSSPRPAPLLPWLLPILCLQLNGPSLLGGHGLSPRVSPSLTLPFPGPLTSRRSFLWDPSLVCPALLWVFTLRLPQGKMKHPTPQIRAQQTDTRDMFHEHGVKTPVLARRAGSSELC